MSPYEFVRWVSVVCTFVGMLAILISVWSSGWLIVRFCITGILFLVMGAGLWVDDKLGDE